ncbi:FGGY carbohydrate kinase domain-containing protein-like [Rhynchophorus ferrugineus]|uniref:FGGY carbohydrate kinase domain-containing protein-like n=1 Tax=Rhynchophorus ferrugineus TaxID=354439 RepID=UPI003FCE2F35
MDCLLRQLGAKIRNKCSLKIHIRWTSSDAVVVDENPHVKGPFFVAAHASSGYCRAGLVNDQGVIAKIAATATKMYQSGSFHEQSSDNVWNGLIHCIKKITENVPIADIKAICFTSRPALVTVDKDGKSLTASVSRDNSRNTIMHFDTRSYREAKLINQTHHSIIQYFGELVLPELQESKVMWLKSHLYEECWKNVGAFYDMTDYLTWRATGSQTRSLSVLISNWSYEITVNGNEGWNSRFFKEIGLEEMETDNWKVIGSSAQLPGKPAGEGLRENVAIEMGLTPGLPVAISMLDQYASGLGLIGCKVEGIDEDITKRLCIAIGALGSSHFVLSHNPVFVKGVWGPFKGVIYPEMWLNQGGQTTSMGLVEYVVDKHPATSTITKRIGKMRIHKYLNKLLKVKAQQRNLKFISYLTRDLHVLPDFNGNRSPLADPLVRGAISGLSLSDNQESLALMYLATLQGITYGTKYIMDTMSHYGFNMNCVFLSGYLGANSVFSHLHADVCRMPVVCPHEPNSCLIGAAILGAVASNHYSSFNEATSAMGGTGKVFKPREDKELIDFHARKYEVLMKMYEHQSLYRSTMSNPMESH